MGAHTAIPGALNSHLASIMPLLPICWENTEFTPPQLTDATQPMVVLFSFTDRTPAATDVYSITIDGVTYPSSGTALASVLQDLKSQIVGCTYVASPPGLIVRGASSGRVFTYGLEVKDGGGLDIAGALPSTPTTLMQIPFIGHAWLEVHHIPGQPQAAGLGTDGKNLQVGVYHVDVRFPAAQGWGECRAYVDVLCSLFKRGTELVRDGITVTISSSGPGPSAVEDGQWFRVPVTIRYYAYTPNE